MTLRPKCVSKVHKETHPALLNSLTLKAYRPASKVPRIGVDPGMRSRSILLAGLAAVMLARATTLQQLSLDDMIQQSTGIVRATVTGSSSGLHGQNIYTFYRLQILETAKGAGSREIEVAVPGGAVNGKREMAVGAPTLAAGSQYVVFLWTGRSGLTQIIGLSQGLFLATPDGSGKIGLVRPAATDLMLDKNGKPVSEEPLGLEWSDLRTRIQRQSGIRGTGK